MKKFLFTIVIFSFLIPLTLSSVSAMSGTNNMAHTKATQAYMDAMNKMHHSMNIQYSGNADIDFLRGMIPHHQGAVDMAQIVLKYGSDPEIRALAQKVIHTQETEISLMKQLLNKHSPANKK